MTGQRPLLMVTPYAPYRDGIAAYAIQEVRDLRSRGVDVEVLSPLPSAAQHHLALGGPRGAAALARRAADYRAVTIQFAPEMFFSRCRHPAQRVAVWAGLLAVARRCALEIRLHEIEYGPLERNPAERALAAQVVRQAASVTVHTHREVEELVRRLGVPASCFTVIDHGAHFAPATASDQAACRGELGLPADRHLFLCIGFIQEHKGFDLAVDAFDRAEPAGSALHIVGSVRVDHPDLLRYAADLERRSRATPGVTLHRRYVSDEEFDRWIVAADTVVLPYREIWSSGVLERAKLHDTAVIAHDVGGLGDQAPQGTLFFTDVDSMAKAMIERAATGTGVAPDQMVERGPAVARRPQVDDVDDEVERLVWEVDPANPDREGLQRQIRQRARREQSLAAAQLDGSAVDALLALQGVARPAAVSARPGVSSLKRIVRRLLDWEVQPLALQINALQRATAQAVMELDSRYPPAAGDPIDPRSDD